MVAKNKGGPLPELSRLEQEIMRVVWQLGECSSAEVIDAYTRERALAKTTIRTVLSNLRKKGYVELVPTVARGHRLRPAVKREQVARRSLRTLVANLFNGSPRHAIAYLLNESEIAAADLDEIRRMIERRKQERGAK